MSAPLLIALLSGVVLVGAAAFAVVRFVALLRQVGATTGALGDSLERISVGAERAAARGETAGAAGERLERAVRSLDRSRARLQVLLRAYGDARETLGSFVFVPRK